MTLFSVFVCCLVLSDDEKSSLDSMKPRHRCRSRFLRLLEYVRKRCSRGVPLGGTASETGLQTRSEKLVSGQCPLGQNCGCVRNESQLIRIKNGKLCAPENVDLLAQVDLVYDEVSDSNGSQDLCTIDLTSKTSQDDETCICLTCASRCTLAKEMMQSSVLWRAAQMDQRYHGTLLGR